jgi:hypothetical protein
MDVLLGLTLKLLARNHSLKARRSEKKISRLDIGCPTVTRKQTIGCVEVDYLWRNNNNMSVARADSFLEQMLMDFILSSGYCGSGVHEPESKMSTISLYGKHQFY